MIELIFQVIISKPKDDDGNLDCKKIEELVKYSLSIIRELKK